MAKRRNTTEPATVAVTNYDGLVGGIANLLEQSRHAAARAINGILTAAYWEIGRRIVEHEQGGQARAEYGERLLNRLAVDLTARFGRGFSRVNLQQMRLFFIGWEICQTPSDKLEARVRLPTELVGTAGPVLQTASAISQIGQTPSAEFDVILISAFPLAWSQLPDEETLRREIETTQRALLPNSTNAAKDKNRKKD